MRNLPNHFAKVFGNGALYASGTTFGDTVTPGTSGAWGTDVQLIDGSTEWPADFGDAYELEITATGAAVAGQACTTWLSLGYHATGGASRSTDLMDPLLVHGVTMTAGRFGTTYTFKLYVPNGWSIFAKASNSGASAGTLSVAIKLRGCPSNPEDVKCGTYVKAYGLSGSSPTLAATAVTPGTTGTKGSYATLGTVGTDDYPFWWQFGINLNNTTINNNASAWDVAVGDGTTRTHVIEDVNAGGNTSEEFTRGTCGGFYAAQPGDTVESRGAVVGSPALATYYAVAYAVCGQMEV